MHTPTLEYPENQKNFQSPAGMFADRDIIAYTFCMDQHDVAEAVIKAVVDQWYLGRLNDPEGLDLLAPESRESLEYLLADISNVQDFAVAIAHGDFTHDFRARGKMARDLLGLHDDLRQLALHAEQVAKGELVQSKIEFGEFSHTFNRIVGMLAQHEERQLQELAEARMATIFAMAKLSEARDEDTGFHLERTRKFCEILARELSHDQRFNRIIDNTFIESLRNASPLHDIGKVAIPDAILLKQGPLNIDEIEIMKEHPRLGAETLKAVRSSYPNNSFIDMGIAIAESHHERWDGQGYPHRLSGIDIPLPARIMAVADVYDALRARRCYKNPLSHNESVDIIMNGSGTQFDPGITDIFQKQASAFDEVWLSMRD